MLADFKKEIQAEITRLNNLRDAVEFLTKEATKLEKDRETVISQLDKLDTKMDTTSIKTIGTNILLDEARKAVKLTKEFNHRLFTTRLEEAIRDPRTLTITFTENVIKVKVDLDLTAGTIENYERAVVETRTKLNMGNSNPIIASKMWQEKYYGAAREGTPILKVNPNRKFKPKDYADKYWNTIRTRIANYNSLAPFWRIIEDGTVSLSMNRGGYPYPFITPTHFVDKAIKRIKDYYYSSIKDNTLSMEKYITLLDQIQSKIEFIQSEISRIASGENVQTILRQQLERTLKAKYPLADPVRREQLISDLISQTVSKSRVQLTKRGSGVRVEARTIELQRLVARSRR
jgi:prefoldin subunit 5